MFGSYSTALISLTIGSSLMINLSFFSAAGTALKYLDIRFFVVSISISPATTKTALLGM